MSISTIHVPYVDLAAQHALIESDLLQSAKEVIGSGQFVLGPQVAEFEERFATVCGVQFAVSVNSGTDALVFAFRALGIGSGDEVITVPNSFVATASAIALVGARPIFVDVTDDQNIDPELIESAITSRTKAILPVHLTGRVADMDAVLAIADQHDLFVVEDAAQAVQAEYKGRRAGAFGIAGCFSLHPLKNLNACGDGGIITTNDESLYRSLLVARNIGLANREQAVEWSGNSRLDTLQAALLLVKLKHLPTWTQQRREHAAYYRDRLSHVPGIDLPLWRKYELPAFHTFVIQTNKRDELKSYLAERGIGTAVHYPIPIHLQKAAAQLGYQQGAFPITECQAEKILSLPVYPELNLEQREYVVDCIRSFAFD